MATTGLAALWFARKVEFRKPATVDTALDSRPCARRSANKVNLELLKPQFRPTRNAPEWWSAASFTGGLTVGIYSAFIGIFRPDRGARPVRLSAADASRSDVAKARDTRLCFDSDSAWNGPKRAW
jgi:hypothetical protein